MSRRDRRPVFRGPLKSEGMPGLVVLGLLIALGVVLLLAVSRLKHQAALLDKLAKDVNVLPPEGVADGAHERIGSDRICASVPVARPLSPCAKPGMNSERR